MNDQFDNVTSYTYDCRNRLTSMTDPEDRLIMVMYHDGSATDFEYDRRGNIAQRTSYDTQEVNKRR